MWRVGIAALPALVALAAQPAYAAHPTRAPCGDRASVMCVLYGAPYRVKLSRAHRTHRSGANAAAGGVHRDQAQPRTSGAKAPDGPMPVLAARADSLSHGIDAGGALLAAPAQAVGPEPWPAMLLIALGAGGILSLLLARAADL